MTAVTWSREAQNDLATLDDGFRRDDPDYSRHIGEFAIKAGVFLAEHSGAGPSVPKTRLRKWRVARTPYLILYRTERDQVFVVRLVHAKRNWKRFL